MIPDAGVVSDGSSRIPDAGTVSDRTPANSVAGAVPDTASRNKSCVRQFGQFRRSLLNTVVPGVASMLIGLGTSLTAQADDAAGIESAGKKSGTAEIPEKTVEAKGPQGPLQGTLTLYDKAGAPVVLIIPGSGPTNRDGNSPLGIRAAPYKLLAEGLAAKGIASLRIDKRGMFGSVKAVPNANAVTVEDYVQDVNAWVQVAQQDMKASCVWLLGHGEGGMIALDAARSNPDRLCGLILVTTAGRPMGRVFAEQLKANPANKPILDSALKAIEKLESGQRVNTDDLEPALRPAFNPEVQGFMISAFSRDPLKLISGVRKPVLIIQGEEDIQVPPGDARLLQQAQPAAKTLLLPGVNHVLKDVKPKDREDNLRAYAEQDRPLAAGLADGIADFIGRHALSQRQ